MSTHPGIEDPRTFLLGLFHSAVAAADPLQVLPPALPQDTAASAIVIGAGKASAAMASALEDNWEGMLSGVVVTPYGHALPCRRIDVLEAAHPVPDAAGELAARRVLAAVSGLRAKDLVICLLSGGGSSLLSLPAPGLTLADKQNITRQLLRSGASIDAINCVRKHLSGIKGGRLAQAAMPARLLTYAISDVAGDDPAVIASGPTLPDPGTSRDAAEILRSYRIAVPRHISDWLQDPRSETPKSGDPAFARQQFTLIASAGQSLQAAIDIATGAGLRVVMLGDNLTGDADALGQAHAEAALQARAEGDARPCLLLSGGETTVNVRGNGRGGRNTQYLLSLAHSLRGADGIHALAADTDGIDGAGDNAGALLAPASWQRAQALGLDAGKMRDNNDAYNFFAALDDLVVTGPTRTNINDFRAILVLS